MLFPLKRLQKILKPAFSQEPGVGVCTGLAAWGRAPRSCREPRHPTCDRRLEAGAVFDRRNVPRKLSSDI